MFFSLGMLLFNVYVYDTQIRFSSFLLTWLAVTGASHSIMCYGLMGLVNDLLLCCYPMARSFGTCELWPVVRLHAWMQP